MLWFVTILSTGIAWGQDAAGFVPGILDGSRRDTRRCRRGNAESCTNLGTLYDTYYDRPGMEKDNTVAAEWYERGCELDDGVA